MTLAEQQEFETLVQHAKLAGQARDWRSARQFWVQALALVPPDSAEYQDTQARIQNIDLQLGAAQQKSARAKRFGKFGSIGTFLLVALSKAKLLLLGLTKLSTFISMLAFFAVYWSLFGWKFALGFVLCIYVHEMGHVMALRKYNIAASAPMFIPFLGAFVRMKQYPGNVGEDARVGLAGPIWGLGTAVVTWLAAITTGLPIWYAIAHTAAWINLFNLLPIWQLDGGRGFRALTRGQRLIAGGVAIAIWAFTHQTILLLIALGAGYRLFSRDYPAEEDNVVLTEYVGLIVLLALLMLMTARIPDTASF
jgi:Zn-dependent protease